jgi:hypothetical protein
MTDEACRDSDEFFARLKTLSMANLYDHVQGTVTAKETTPEALRALLPYSSVCWLPSGRAGDPTDVHLYTRRATRCVGCTEYNELFIWDDQHPTVLLGCVSGEITFDAQFLSTWNPGVWRDPEGAVALASPVIHDVVTRIALVDHLPVVAPFYAYGCAGGGTVVEWSMEIATQLTEAWPGMEPWLAALEKVKGFLAAPTPKLFDAAGRVHDLSTLCWTHPKVPKRRWCAPMQALPARMRVPEGGVDRVDLHGMRGLQRWFYEAVRGGAPVRGTLTVRTWNTWITWCSLALSAWPEGQVAFLTPVVPKPPLQSVSACLDYLGTLASAPEAGA